MKIINVHPGILPIPPKNWGAIEKAIWNYHLNFEKLGITSEIKYLDDIQNDNTAIVHSHVTNLANMAHDREIEYFFSMHDHHVLFEYPDKTYLEETRKAIKNSIKTIVHSPTVLTHKNFKDISHKMIYVQHGVDTDIYKNMNIDRTGDLLCVGSNGFINHRMFDRKGFILAKHCAESLNLNLTICSPSSNLDFFKHYRFFESSNINIKFDLNEDELINEYNTHKIFLHPSVLEAGDPNLTLVEANACGIKIVGSYHGELKIDGMIVVNDLTPTSYINAINTALDNSNSIVLNSDFTWRNVSKKLIGIYKKYGNTLNKFTLSVLDSYSTKNELTHGVVTEPKLSISFDMVPKVELKTFDNKEYQIKFASVDELGIETVVYQIGLSNNMWAKPSDVYAKNWKIYIDDELTYETNISLENDVCAVVSTYPNSEDVNNKTIKTIKNIKDNIGIKTICATHTEYEPNPTELIKNSDEYIFNSINTLTQHNYYKYYNGNHDGYNVFLDLWESGNGSYHGPAVQQNYYNGIRRAKSLGYKYALLTNFDMLFSTEDINKIKCILNTVSVNNADGFFFFTNEPEGPTFKTVFCVVNVDLFLQTFPEILKAEDYEQFVKKLGSESNGLENVYYHALKNAPKLIIKQMSESQFFNIDTCFTNSQTDYFAILPFDGDGYNNAALFIKRANKNVLPYKITITGYQSENDINIIDSEYLVDTDFYKIIPFTFKDGVPHYFSLMCEDTTPWSLKRIEVHDYYNQVIPNGMVKK